MNRLLKLGTGSVLTLAMTVALAQQQPANSSGASAGGEVAEVIVTGTRRTDRTVTESSAPIDVLVGTDLAAQPTGNMLDTLSALVPSFSVGQNSISDASSFVRAPSLRGLPGDEMLVMLNGKRMNRSALVQVYQGGETELAFGSQGPDLASIPSIAVKALEVLRDGASAQYGSDAIAGVLNYQFRTNTSGVEVNGRFGKYFPSNGFSSDGDDSQIGINIGLPLGGTGFLNLSAELAKDQQTNRGATRPSAILLAQEFPNLAPYLPHYPGPVQEWGTPPSKSVKTFLNAGIKLDNGDQFYFFANWADIESNESFNFRLPVPVTNGTLSFGNHPAFNNIYTETCASQPTYTGCAPGGFISSLDGTAAPIFNFTSVYPGGFTPRFYGDTMEFFGAVGYKGKTSWGMNYDISGTTATNSLAVSLQHSLNPSLGPVSPTSFYDGKFVQKENNLNIDVVYPVEMGLASPLNIAAGVEYRNENYQQLQGDPASYAAGPYAVQPLYTCTTVAGAVGCSLTGSAGQSTASNGYGGISQDVDASQVSYAAYIDLEADVVKNLTVGVAGRFENYASFGSTTNGKLQIRWKVIDALALRGTVSTGFHAPTPGQSNVETLSTTFAPGTANQIQIGTYPVQSAIAQYYGAVALKPEESTNISAGLVLTPAESLLFTLDGYQIDVRNRIGISQTFNVTQADINNLAALSYVGVGGTVQYFTNGFSTRTKGIDLVGSYAMHVGSGRLDTTLAWNYNKTDVTKFDPSVISASRIIDIQHSAPNTRVNAAVAYTLDKFRFGVHENYYGTWRDENDYPGQLFSAKFTTDLDASYQVLEHLNVGLGAKNLFNAFPDRIANSAANTVYPISGGLIDGQIYPRTGGPFGMNGRFVYLHFNGSF